jgi:hypothetical protein
MRNVVVGSVFAVVVGSASGALALGPVGGGPVFGGGTQAWQGGFQKQDDAGDLFTPINSVRNPFTGGYTCPTGFTPQWSGRVMGPESRVGVTQFQCVDGPRTLSSVKFGGMYQITDRVPPEISHRRFWVVPNPVTGWAVCPEKFTPVWIGRVLFPEVEIGANQYACISTDPTAVDLGFGGMYQTNDCFGGSDVRHPVTRDFRCPDGFKSFRSGRVKAPEGQCGANQYVCMRAP